MRKLIPVALILLAAALANAQTVRVDFPPMPINKVRVGLWLTAKEPAEVTVDFGDGKLVKLNRKKVKTRFGEVEVGDVSIAATYVDGMGAKRTVRACVCEGTLQDGSKFSMALPPEDVVFDHMERQGFLRWKPVMLAVAINCPTVITRPDGKVWQSLVYGPACPTHSAGRGVRIADAVSYTGTLTLKKGP